MKNRPKQSDKMALFRDMEPRAKKAKEVEEKMTSCRLEIETLTELLATRKAEMKDLEAELQELRMQKCKKGVMWKGSAAHYVLNGLEETLKLEKQLKTGTYKARQTTKFRVTYPKPRDIVSICFRDRVYQRSLNDNAIYPAMTKSFIQHNCACQKDKGTDYARTVLDEFLHRHYRKYGRAGGVLQVDVHGYYPNMKHQVAKDKFKKHLEPDIYKRAEAVLED